MNRSDAYNRSRAIIDGKTTLTAEQKTRACECMKNYFEQLATHDNATRERIAAELTATLAPYRDQIRRWVARHRSPRGGRSKRWLKRVRFYARQRKMRGLVTVYEEWMRFDEQYQHAMFRFDARGRRVYLTEPRMLFMSEVGIYIMEPPPSPPAPG